MKTWAWMFDLDEAAMEDALRHKAEGAMQDGDDALIAMAKGEDWDKYLDFWKGEAKYGYYDFYTDGTCYPSYIKANLKRWMLKYAPELCQGE